MFGNQGWTNSRLGINTQTPKVSHRKEFRADVDDEGNEGNYTTGGKTLPEGVRVNDDGYLTNEPLLADGQDKDYWVFTIEKDGDTYYKAIMDSDFEDINGRTSCAGNRYKRDANNYRATSVQGIIEGLETRYWNQYCTTTKNHYWIDKTEKYSIGCKSIGADNYDANVDFWDSRLCTYSCDDEYRVKTPLGDCDGENCIEGYTYDADKEKCVEVKSQEETESDFDLSRISPGILVGGLAVLGLLILR